MSMKTKIFVILFLSIHLLGCKGQNTQIPSAITSAEPIVINRFDKALFQWIARFYPKY